MVEAVCCAVALALVCAWYVEPGDQELRWQYSAKAEKTKDCGLARNVAKRRMVRNARDPRQH